MTMIEKHNSRGNVLFIILIGIALLAALTWAATRSGRGNASISREYAMIYATEIIKYAQSVEEATHRIMYGGTEVGHISFENSSVTGYDHSPVEPATNQVFHSSGGGLGYLVPKTSWLDSTFSAKPLYGEWYFPAKICVDNVGTGTATCESDATSNEELLVVLPFINHDICTAINDKLGVTNPSNEPPALSGCGWTVATPEKFVGTLSDGKDIDAAQLDGKLAGCFAVTACATFAPPTSYHFFHVINAR